MKRSTALASIALGLGWPAIARAQTPTPIRIALIPNDTATAVYAANDLGYFAKAGLAPQIIELPNGGAIASAVAGGSADIGLTSTLAIAFAHQRGVPFKILTCDGLSIKGVPSNGLLAVAANSPIRTAKDLTGKTVGVDVLNGIPDLGVKVWVDANEGDSKTVKMIEVPFASMIEAVRVGRLDAALVNATVDPTVGKPGDPLRLLGTVYDAISPHFASSLWFTTSDWIAQHPAAANAFTAAFAQAATWANAHHHDSAVILAKYTKQTVAQIDGSQRVVFEASKEPALFQPLIDVAAKYGLIAAPFPARDILAP